MRELIDKLVGEIVLNKKEQSFVKTMASSLVKTKFLNNSHFYETLFLIKRFFNAPKVGIRVVDDLQWVRMGPECKSIFEKYNYKYHYRYDGESMEDIFAIFKKFCINYGATIKAGLSPENDKKLQIPLQMAEELFNLAFRETLVRHKNDSTIKEYLVMRDVPEDVYDVFGDLMSEL
jgi:hypothetical protein